MNLTIRATVVVSLAIGVPWHVCAESTDPDRPMKKTLIENVSIVDVIAGSVDPNRSVLIEGDRIAGIGPQTIVPDDAVVVDGSSGFLIPGLWDMHVHTFNNNDPQPPNTWTFPLYLAHGVTGVRDMWVRPGEQAEQVRIWRREMEQGRLAGPRFGAIGTLVDGNPPLQQSDVVTTAAEARAFVASLAEAEIDFVKVYSGLTPEGFHTLVAAAREAGLHVAGHGPNALSSFEVAAAGQRSIEHLTGIHETCSSQEDSLRAAGVWVQESPQTVVPTYDSKKCASLFERFVERGTWQVPTLVTNRIWTATASLQALRRDDGWLYTPVWEAAEWDWVANFLSNSSAEDRAAYEGLYRLEQRIVGEMHAAGVPLLAGTDVGYPYIYPGSSLLDELEELVEAGLSPSSALRTATINPARYLGRTEDFGSVESGKFADLVLLDANPLDDIAHLRQVRAVVIGGRLLSHDDLERMKHAVLAKNYQEALAQPPPLRVQAFTPETLRNFVGSYAREGREGQARVELEDGVLRVIIGDVVDALEPLGGTLFRVIGSGVLYVFHTTPDGAVWGFELNEGKKTPMTFRRASR